MTSEEVKHTHIGDRSADDEFSKEKFNVLFGSCPSEFLDEVDRMIGNEAEDSWLRINFGYYKALVDEEYIYQRFNFRSEDDLSNSIAVFKFNSKEKYLFKGELNIEQLKEWLKSIIDEKAEKFIGKEKRHENDVYSTEKPHLKSVVYETFDEIVLDSNKDVFIALCYDKKHEAALVTKMSEILKDESQLIVARMDSSHNDYSVDYFPKDKNYPRLCFCSAENKTPIIRDVFIENDYITAKQLLTWIHECSTHKFDLDKYVSEAEKFDEFTKLKDECGGAVWKIEGKLEALRSIHPEFTHPGEEFTILLKKAIKECNIEQMTEYLEKVKSVDIQDMVDLLESYKKGKVVSLKPDETIESYLEKHEKVILDFTAVWCGPCQFIAPLFGQLSTQHEDILFLKVDADECAEQVQLLKVDGFPTFKSYKGKTQIQSIIGSDLKGLKNMVNKLSSQ